MTPLEQRVTHVMQGGTMEIVGNRPREERRASRWAERAMLGTALLGLGYGIGLLGSEALLKPALTWAEHVERAQVAQWLPVQPAQDRLTPLIEAERAWLEHRWSDAGSQWRQWAVAHHDLEAAGWALRAAVREGSDAHLETARQAWNATREQLPARLQAEIPVLPDLRPPAVTPSLDPQARQAYQDLWQQHRGDLIFAAQNGWSEMVQTAIKDGTLSHLVAQIRPADRQEWLSRNRPTRAEADVHDAGCDQLGLPCQEAPVLTLSERYEQADQQVKRFQRQGFEPAQAWAYAQEQRLLGRADHTWTPASVERTELERQVMAFRDQQRRALAQVHTPAALVAYFQQWQQAPEAIKTAFEKDGRSALLFGGLIAGQVDWAARFAGHADGSWKREKVFKTPTSVTWEDLMDQWQNQLRGLPGGATPAHLTLATAQAHLMGALRDAGVAELTLDANLPASAEVVWRLGDQVQAANASLQAHTGWTGGVVGLQGRLRWVISSEATAEKPGAAQTYGLMAPVLESTDRDSLNQVLVYTVANSESLGPIAHEWTHALAHVCGEHDDQGHLVLGAESQAAETMSSPWSVLSRQWIHGAPGQMAWEQLWQSLRSPPLTERERVTNAMERWYGEVVWATGQRTLALRELLEVSQDHWSPQQAAHRWAQVDEKGYLVRQLDRQLTAQFDGSPEWASTTTRFTQSGWMRSNLATAENTAYLNDPAEALARSAEAAFRTEPNMVRNDIVNTIIYPSSQELAYQHQAWTRFYAQMTPWWNAQRPARPTLGQVLGQTAPAARTPATAGVVRRPLAP